MISSRLTEAEMEILTALREGRLSIDAARDIMTDQPLTISFSGPPGSGAAIFSEIVSTTLKALGFRIEAAPSDDTGCDIFVFSQATDRTTRDKIDCLIHDSERTALEKFRIMCNYIPANSGDDWHTDSSATVNKSADAPPSDPFASIDEWIENRLKMQPPYGWEGSFQARAPYTPCAVLVIPVEKAAEIARKAVRRVVRER